MRSCNVRHDDDIRKLTALSSVQIARCTRVNDTAWMRMCRFTQVYKTYGHFPPDNAFTRTPMLAKSSERVCCVCFVLLGLGAGPHVYACARVCVCVCVDIYFAHTLFHDSLTYDYAWNIAVEIRKVDGRYGSIRRLAVFLHRLTCSTKTPESRKCTVTVSIAPTANTQFGSFTMSCVCFSLESRYAGVYIIRSIFIMINSCIYASYINLSS